MSEWPLRVRAKLAYSAWRRKQAKKKYAGVFQEASAVLFRHDPIGISSEDNTDEYDPEVGYGSVRTTKRPVPLPRPAPIFTT